MKVRYLLHGERMMWGMGGGGGRGAPGGESECYDAESFQVHAGDVSSAFA
jgi:hypothetical protein